MTVSDYIFEKLVLLGVDTCFQVVGGYSMFLNDSVKRNKNIKCYHFHHENVCSNAADAYYRQTGKPAVIILTTGVGYLNALNGIASMYFGSIPCIVIVGDSQTDLISKNNIGVRQTGDQSTDIISVSQTITKQSLLLDNTKNLSFDIEHSYHITTHGRCGPIVINIPIDIQKKDIDDKQVTLDYHFDTMVDYADKDHSIEITNRIKESKSPVILTGTGIRLSNSYSQFKLLVDKLNVPVVYGFNSYDLLDNNHRLYAGKVGTIGDTGGNTVIQNADLVLILGNGMSIRTTGYKYKEFMKNAYKIMVDIDDREMNKVNVNIDMKVRTDLRIFFDRMLQNLKEPLPEKTEWVNWCKSINYKYPVLQKKHIESKTLNPYYFYSVLSNVLDKDAIVVTANGGASVIGSQTYKCKVGQRFYTSGNGSMGYGLSASIGAYIGSGKQVICLEGDGSIMMSIHELATVKHLNANIKIFVLNNNGYSSIRQTQNNYFKGNYVGCTESDLTFPKWSLVADSYGINYCKIYDSKNIKNRIDYILNSFGPMLIEVVVDKDCIFEPKGIDYEPKEVFK